MGLRSELSAGEAALWRAAAFLRAHPYDEAATRDYVLAAHAELREELLIGARARSIDILTVWDSGELLETIRVTA